MEALKFQGTHMAVQLDYLIVFAHDKHASARFLAELLGLDNPEPSGVFVPVDVGPTLTLNFAEPGVDFPGQHYAFLVGEDDFDAILARIHQRGMPFWADPHKRRLGEINRNDGGRGLYFDDLAGHGLEIIT
jgi:extradiol dioxygenase family protein